MRITSHRITAIGLDLTEQMDTVHRMGLGRSAFGLYGFVQKRKRCKGVLGVGVGVRDTTADSEPSILV